MAEKQRKPRRTCLVIFLVISVLVVCCLIVGGGGGYYLYSTGQLELNDLLRWIGLGPAEIQIINLSDGNLSAELIYFDEDVGESSKHTSLDLASYDIYTISGLSAGKYQLTFTSALGYPEDSTCWMDIHRGDQYRFAAIPDGIAVVLTGKDAESIQEIDIQTSAICAP